jgi:hypothetical protein
MSDTYYNANDVGLYCDERTFPDSEELKGVGLDQVIFDFVKGNDWSGNRRIKINNELQNAERNPFIPFGKVELEGFPVCYVKPKEEEVPADISGIYEILTAPWSKQEKILMLKGKEPYSVMVSSKGGKIFGSASFKRRGGTIKFRSADFLYDLKEIPRLFSLPNVSPFVPSENYRLTQPLP